MILQELQKRAAQRTQSQFHPDQARVFLSKDASGNFHRFCGILCPRRWGKTEGVLRRFGQLAATTERARFAYLVLQRNQAEEIAWPILEDLNIKLGWGCHIDKVRLKMTWPRTGGMIRLYGADKINTTRLFRGMKWHGVHIDECQDFVFTDLDNLVQSSVMPSLADYNGFLYITGTPGIHKSGFFYNLMIKKKYPFFKLFYADSMKNPHTSEGIKAILDRYRQTGVDIENTPFIRREYFAEWVEDDRYRVINLNPSLNYLYHWQRHPADKYYLGIDFGFAGTSAYVVGVENREIHPNCLYYVDAWQQRDMLLKDHLRKIQEFQQRYGKITVIGDTGGPGTGIVRELQSSYGIKIVNAEKTDKRLNVIRLNNDAQGGHVKIFNPNDPDKPHESLMADQWNTLQKVWKKTVQLDDQENIEDSMAEEWEEGNPHHLHDAALYVRNAATITYHTATEPKKIKSESERMMDHRIRKIRQQQVPARWR